MLMRLAELRNGDVLFIDEIHEIPNQVAVFLYEAMQHGQLSISITRAGRPHPVTLRVPAFTLIGATTDERQLPEPFVARFENREQLRYYDVGELTELIMKVAQCAISPIAPNAANAARPGPGRPRVRGTPAVTQRQPAGGATRRVAAWQRITPRGPRFARRSSPPRTPRRAAF